MMDGDFDEDDLFGAINAVDISDTAQGGGTQTAPGDDDDDALLNQQLESMGLTSNTNDEQKRKQNTMMATMASPPASAPPPAPSTNTKSQSAQKDALMQSLMMGSVGGGSGGGNVVRENSEEEDLFGAISGSGNNGGGDGDDLFGIGDDEEDDDDDLFQTTVMEEQQQSQSSTSATTKPTNSHNHNGGTTTSDDDQGGIVIAPPNDPLSSSILDSNHNGGRHYEQQQGNAMMMSYAPTGEESFYRTHNESQFLGTAKPSSNNHNSNQYMQNPSQQQQQSSIVAPSAPSENHYSTNFVPVFNNVVVGDPKFISEGGGGGGVRLLSTLTGGSSSKYWLYTVTSTQTNLPEYKKFVVQRRFRHFDALQERLRTACPGAILPPRPPKHEGLDVAPGSKQSAAFAVQRASELNLYLRSLIVHPIAGNSEPLQFFLTFVDRDLGTAWPEVSNNALTRLTAGINKTAGEATAAAAAGMTTLSNGVTSIQHAGSSIVNNTTTGYPNTRTTAASTSGTNLSQSMTSIVPSDQNVELAQLLSNESHRMNLVTQAIPKLEGCLILLKDVQQAQGLFAMEWSKLSKDMKLDDKPISRLSDIVGLAMLKTARRNRKNVSDSFKILVPLLQQSKLVSMEKCAILDRQQALEKVWKLRQSHQTAQQSLQSQQHIYHTHPMAQQFHAQAHYSGQLLEEATKRADAISNVLHGEILRSQETRRQDIFWSLKLFSSTMKDTQRDVTNTWKDALLSFKKSFPVE